MSTSLDHLLPEADDSIRCAEHARAIAVDPGGTAIRADRIVVVSTPLPWPKPALDHALLQAMAAELRRSPIPTRLLAAVPAENHPVGHVIVYDRAGPSALERRYDVGTQPERFRALGSALALADTAERSAQLAKFGASVPTAARPAVLVCTQGSHDVCCGSEGTRLADELDALTSDRTSALTSGRTSDQASEAMSARHGQRGEGLQVFRVSHTGGHRFAPTALTMPDGRMWAGVSAAMVGSIVNAEGDVHTLVEHCRGWWGAEAGSAQMAERAIFAQLGWPLNSLDRTVGVERSDSGDSDLCAVNAGDRSWQVDVAVGREIPTIACRQPGGLPAKPGREYTVRSVRGGPSGDWSASRT